MINANHVPIAILFVMKIVYEVHTKYNSNCIKITLK